MSCIPPIIVALSMFLCACLPMTETATQTETAAPPSPILTLTITPLVPSQDWTARTVLIVGKREGAWLRSEPDSTSTYPGMPILSDGTAVRVIGKPFYETPPGQWWWLVSAESGDIGWVEEASLEASLTVTITAPSR